MKKIKIKGLTAKETLIVILIIGIIAAFVIPKLTRYTEDAQKSATIAVASALSASNASNYAARKLHSNLGIPIKNCTDVEITMQGAFPKSAYTITAEKVDPDKSTKCILYGPNNQVIYFTATGIR